VQQPDRVIPDPAPRRAAIHAVTATVIAALIGTAALLYVAPAGEADRFGLDAEAAQPFARALASTDRPPPLSRTAFVWSFRGLVSLAWLGWGAVVILNSRHSVYGWRTACVLVSATALVAAVACPPVLSNDVYGYVAFARVPLFYGLNPYDAPRAALEAVGDPAARLIIWNAPIPYGPLWTMIATAMAAVGAAGDLSLFGEAVAHKLLAGASLVVASVASAVVAERSAPGKGVVTLLAVGLNPLLVLEGPGSGHNDLIMLAFMMAGAALDRPPRRSACALFLGLAVAIKPTALAAVPLLMCASWFDLGQDRWRRVTWIVFLAMAPSLVLSLPYGGPLSLFHASAGRVALGNQPAQLLAGGMLVLAALAWGCWVIRTDRRPNATVWLSAWVPVALVLALIVSPVPFPWYLSWASLPALAGWDARHRTLIVSTSVLGLAYYWLR
jgi:hypothetical protein